MEHHDLSSLRFINTGAAPQPPEALARAAGMTGVPVITGYGLTESAPVCHSPVPSRDRDHGARSELTRAGFVGSPVNDIEIRIVGTETGQGALSSETVGELVVRGP